MSLHVNGVALVPYFHQTLLAYCVVLTDFVWLIDFGKAEVGSAFKVDGESQHCFVYSAVDH